MEINKNPERKDLLWFGALLPVFVALIGFAVERRTGSTTAEQAIWVTGGAIAAGFWAIPAWRRPIFLGFGYVSYPIGWVVTKVLLLAIFVVIVTPTGILMRALGKDPLGLKLRPDQPSYWLSRRGQRDKEDYFRQF